MFSSQEHEGLPSLMFLRPWPAPSPHPTSVSVLFKCLPWHCWLCFWVPVKEISPLFFANQLSQFSSVPLGDRSLAYPDLSQLGKHSNVWTRPHVFFTSAVHPGRVNPERWVFIPVVESVGDWCHVHSTFIFRTEFEGWLLSMGKDNPDRDLRESSDSVLSGGHFEC